MSGTGATETRAHRGEDRLLGVLVSQEVADTPLSQDQGGHLVVKAADGSAESAGRIATARSAAVAQLRDMFLAGIRSAEQLNRTWIASTDPRAALRAFISRFQ
ncbi:hypothetical protein ACFV4T_08070 [Streptomyces sp. NPDC059755]|uniref:hypothetical protein n=1 Tax=Streptomyces sp. NPDC059755 TaxID=3346934 RepID=UPI003668662D